VAYFHGPGLWCGSMAVANCWYDAARSVVLARSSQRVVSEISGPVR
jgi:hypothetical protein